MVINFITFHWKYFLRSDISLEASSTVQLIRSPIPKLSSSVRVLVDVNTYLTTFLTYAEYLQLNNWFFSRLTIIGNLYSRIDQSTSYERITITFLLSICSGTPCFGWQRNSLNSFFLLWWLKILTLSSSWHDKKREKASKKDMHDFRIIWFCCSIIAHKDHIIAPAPFRFCMWDLSSCVGLNVFSA